VKNFAGKNKRKEGSTAETVWVPDGSREKGGFTWGGDWHARTRARRGGGGATKVISGKKKGRWQGKQRFSKEPPPANTQRGGVKNEGKIRGMDCTGRRTKKKKKVRFCVGIANRGTGGGEPSKGKRTEEIRTPFQPGGPHVLPKKKGPVEVGRE